MDASTRTRLGRAGIIVLLVAILSGHVTAQIPFWSPVPDFVSELFDGQINFLGGVPGIEASMEVTTVDSYQNEARCLAHPLSVPSQGFHISGSGFHISGSVGGMVLGPIEVLNEDGTVDSTPVAGSVGAVWQQASGSSAQNWADWLAGRSPRSDTDVVVFVADDFAGGRYELPTELFGLQPGQEPDLEALVANGEISHGALVMHHLNAMMGGTGVLEFDPSASDTVNGRTVWRFGSDPSSRLVVQAMDLSTGPGQLIDTDQIVGQVANSAERYLGQMEDPGLETHFVLNMSWVLLPCPTVKAFMNAQADFGTFEAYLNALEVPSITDGSLNDGDGYVANVLRLLSWVGPENTLFKAIVDDPAVPGTPPMVDGLFPDARIAFVAATGNFGMDYQMLPAAWPIVVGAGAPDDPPPPFSNLAEVLAPGAWFLLEPLPSIESPLSTGVSPQVSYAGTSFSAPMVSLVAAIDLITDIRCTPSDFRSEVPGLASDPASDAPLRAALDGCGY